MLNEHHRRKPYINGIETIDYYQREYSSIPFIGQSTFFNFDLALQLMKRGTSDYSVNPVDREKLATVGADGMNIRQIKILRGIARRYPH